MPGWVFATSARIDGKNAAAMHGVVRTVMGSASIPRSAPTAERAAPTPATTSRACRANTSPAAVSRAGRWVRSTRRTPRSRSRAAMCALTRDWERWTVADAAVNPPRSATARKVSSQSNSTLRSCPGTGAVAPMKDPGFTRCEPWLTTGTMRIADVVFGMTHW